MTLNELSLKLREMYDNASKGEKVTMIHLFGIKYHDQIKNIGIKPIVEQSGIRSTYHAELSKAIRLAKYVRLQ